MSGGSFQLYVMRNCGSLPLPSYVLLYLNPPTPSSYHHPVSISCLPVTILLLFLTFSGFPLPSPHPCSNCRPPSTPTSWIPPHSLPTKFLSLRGWDGGVLKLKSLVRKLTRMGHSCCCSRDPATHSCTLTLGNRKGVCSEQRGGWVINLVLDLRLNFMFLVDVEVSRK